MFKWTISPTIRQSLRCLWGTAATSLEMPEATPTSPQGQTLRGRIQPYFLFVYLAGVDADWLAAADEDAPDGYGLFERFAEAEVGAGPLGGALSER